MTPNQSVQDMGVDLLSIYRKPARNNGRNRMIIQRGLPCRFSSNREKCLHGGPYHNICARFSAACPINVLMPMVPRKKANRCYSTYFRAAIQRSATLYDWADVF